MRRTSEIIAAAEDAADMRRRLGAAALEMDASSDGSWQTQWRATVAARLPSQHWPQRTVLTTAVDARTGEPVVFDRHSGVDLADAVAASCASGLPYRIGDNRYIDGGYRRNENADLAAGYGGCWCCHRLAAEHGRRWGGACILPHRPTNYAPAAAESKTILPDNDSRGAFGVNLMDPSTRPPAARAGYNQGRALAEQLTEFWR